MEDVEELRRRETPPRHTGASERPASPGAPDAPGATEARRSTAWFALDLAFIAALLVLSWLIASKTRSNDVIEYFQYAHAFWLEHPRFHALPTEYPPLAILPFTLTLLPPLADHRAVFALWMCAAVALAYLAYRRVSTRVDKRRSGLAFVEYLTLGAASVYLGRYDLVPALVTLAALWAAQRRRFPLAYLLLALGVLLKLYPIFFFPLALIEQWRVLGGAGEGEGAPVAGPSGARGVGAALGELMQAPATRRIARALAPALALLVAGFGVAFALNPHGALSEFRFASARPSQVESVPGMLLWLASLAGVPTQNVFSFGSQNFISPLDVALKPLSAVALVAGCLWAYWRFLRGRLTLAAAFLACALVIVATNKVFSTQYLIWVFPFVAEVEGLNLLWVAICLLTTLEYPVLYHLAYDQQQAAYVFPFQLTVALRNALFLVATLRALLGGEGAAGRAWSFPRLRSPSAREAGRLTAK